MGDVRGQARCSRGKAAQVPRVYESVLVLGCCCRAKRGDIRYDLAGVMANSRRINQRMAVL